jgi:ribonucleoside-diphosphate reductase alpha chain
LIKEVIKRDGTVEPFEADKLNLWAEWATNGGVSWSEIVMSAVKKLNDKCTTKDIHKALIDTCLEKQTYQHADVAARLLVGQIYKEVFGGFVEPPKLKDFYSKMVSDGKWVDLGYTEEELDEIDEFIIHNKDFGYQFSSLRQMVDKYLIKNKHTGELFETPQFMYVGISLAAMQDQPLERRIEDVIKLYTYLSDLKINVPTPTLSGMRTNFKGYASCCLFTTDDTADSIEAGSHIAYRFTNASAGIGGYMHSRSVKDPVRGGDIVHYGKLPYLRYYESAVKSTKQAVRGGSATMHINILDPEMEDLIRLKHPTTPTQKQIRGLDYSSSMNKLFIEKVAKNEQWMLISCYYAPDLYDKFYSSDYEGFVELYNKYEKDSSVPKKFVNARELAIEIQKNWRETGRVYKTFIDEINRHTPFKDKIYSSNL